MATYTITANGTEMGTYTGATAEHALAAYYRDAGYRAEVVDGELTVVGLPENVSVEDATATRLPTTIPGAEAWTVEQFGDDSWSVLGPDGVDGNEIEWPSDADVSAAAGVPLRFFDAGDHPTRPEAIYRRA